MAYESAKTITEQGLESLGKYKNYFLNMQYPSSSL